MRRLAALLLAVAAVVWVRGLEPAAPAGAGGTALALGFTLLAAWIAGDVIRRLHVPRLTGYLLFGVLVGPYLGNVISEAMAGQLQVITGVATTLIALIAGLSLNVERLGRRLTAIARMTATTLATAMAGLFAFAWVAWPWLGIAPDATGVDRLVMATLLVPIVVSFSPTMTAAVTAETGARGRLSELVLAMVILADLVLLVLFSHAMQLARTSFGARGDEVTLLARFAWEIGGASAFGALVGALFALYVRYIGHEIALVLIAACTVLSQVGTTQEFEPLLAAVTAGLVIENLAVAQGDALRAAVQRAAPPVLLVFFVAVGTSLRLDALAIGGLVALAISIWRIAMIRAGVSAGLAVSGLDRATGSYAWTGLISQAGITLGFASIVAAEFPGWGTNVQMLLVALIAIHELVGPVVFRQGLARAGEIDPHASRPLLVVSNREPYLHRRNHDGRIVAAPATGGVAVALDALMRERGGVWIAHGAGPADREVVDESDKVRVPPDNPSYALRRLWIDEPTFSAYYGGFANEGLWPLCHMVDIRPQFRTEDWAAYQAVNVRFAAAIDEELASSDAPVFIQDYHLALVAPALRARRPDARTAFFWHIPWPYPDRLCICPWRRELLAGLLANDLLAFQLERDRRNFLLAAEEELGAEIDAEASRVEFEGRNTTVISVPIGIDFDRIQRIAVDPALTREQERLVSMFGLRAEIVGLGVDRLDYTKGIPERLAALDAVLTRVPDLRGRLTFVQIGVPSRSELASYGAIEAEISDAISDLNAKHRVEGGAPAVVYHRSPLGIRSLVALYRIAHFCIVSSLHDGMNLVAKEFVASRDDEDGVLVLSALAGAAQELHEALIINPYDIDGFAGALVRAIEMPRTERAARMRAMRRVVAGRNVFGWASDILEGLESLWSKPLHYLTAFPAGDGAAVVRGPEDAPV
ncbi:MAG: trehalose-6-phosphate synthase [Acidobacteria bacterium]|nr:trehalose-6-phosphate synthase [Acidobacteriota bacterium]